MGRKALERLWRPEEGCVEDAPWQAEGHEREEGGVCHLHKEVQGLR